MNGFVDDHRQFEEMIKRYDEVMAQKANKTSLIGIEKKCREEFVKKEDMETETEELRD